MSGKIVRKIVRKKIALLEVLISIASYQAVPAHATVMGDYLSLRDIYEFAGKPEQAQMEASARATIAIVDTRYWQQDYDKGATWKMVAQALKDQPQFNGRLLKGLPFANQPVASDCTGVMIADDLLLTAAHCLPSDQVRALKYTRFLSGYAYPTKESRATPLDIILSSSNVGEAKEILYRGTPTQMNEVSTSDFAIVRLKKPFPGLTPLKLQPETDYSIDKKIICMGYPYGLPLKIEPDAYVNKTDAKSSPFLFSSIIDTGGGNSGGPILDKDTHGIIGIFIAGPRDFIEKKVDGSSTASWLYTQYNEVEMRKYDVHVSIKASAIMAKLIELGLSAPLQDPKN